MRMIKSIIGIVLALGLTLVIPGTMLVLQTIAALVTTSYVLIRSDFKAQRRQWLCLSLLSLSLFCIGTLVYSYGPAKPSGTGDNAARESIHYMCELGETKDLITAAWSRVSGSSSGTNPESFCVLTNLPMAASNLSAYPDLRGADLLVLADSTLLALYYWLRPKHN